MLDAINVCRRYISAKTCSEMALNSLISLQNEVCEFNAKKVKQTKLSDSLNQGQINNNVLFFNIFVVCKI